ncbi:hypothetical protein Pcinc_029892, partial [Petrolisthes cinctipes]
TRLVLLQGEYKKQELIIKRYREQTKLLLDHKTALAKTLSVLETIEIAEQQEQLPQATTRATSALPSKIDEDWENLCSVSASCQSWWLSGKPRKLAKVTACSTPTLSDDSADRNSEAPPQSVTGTVVLKPRRVRVEKNNCHLPNAGENCNIGGNKSGDKSGNNNRRIGNRQQQSRQRATRTRQQQEVHHHPPTAQHGSSLSPRHPAGQGNSIYNRPAKQHRPPAPPKGRGRSQCVVIAPAEAHYQGLQNKGSRTKARTPSKTTSQAVEGKVKFGSVTLPLQDHVKILGVTFDAELRFDKHIHHISHQASLRVSALRRVAGFLDKRGLMTLYKAQTGVIGVVFVWLEGEVEEEVVVETVLEEVEEEVVVETVLEEVEEEVVVETVLEEVEEEVVVETVLEEVEVEEVEEEEVDGRGRGGVCVVGAGGWE